MKPIVITLLLLPPIVLVVTLCHYWWQRASRSPVKAYQIQRIQFFVFLALGPLGVWIFTSMDHTDYLFWALIWIPWVVGVFRGISILRKYRRRLVFKT